MSDVSYNYRLHERRETGLFRYQINDSIKRPSRKNERTIDKAVIARIQKEIEREDIIVNEPLEENNTPTSVSVTSWSEWTVYDFLVVGGAALMLVGFLVTLFPDSRRFGVLFPVGAALVAMAAFAARRRDDETIV